MNYEVGRERVKWRKDKVRRHGEKTLEKEAVRECCEQVL